MDKLGGEKEKLLLIVIVLLGVLGFWSIDGDEIFEDMEQHSEYVQEAVDEVIKSGYMTSAGKGQFNPDGIITIEQSMKILTRLLEEDTREYKEVAIKEGVLRPSDMVYSKEQWESTWREIIKGNKVFDRIGEGTYSITIIPGYFRVHLNEQGYDVVKKGMIPQQVSFYTPFMDIYSYSPEVLEQTATKGFFIELLTIYDIKKGKEEYTGSEQRKRSSVMRELTLKEMEAEYGEESSWGEEEYNKYNFLGISYNGQMRYAQARGILSEDVTIVEMNQPITRAEAAILIERVRHLDREGLIERLSEVQGTGKIEKLSGERK